ncbi:MAG TPA: response regulator transcription factor [Candidatus Faecivivens stercoravium]|uniref:Stage 0 sporulation protein A homolog n=1 Tax=Candidatus Faecivivens stercoravium TaxID=2840803 RepID=A0A9D1J4V7_9FIRM|nr:response regulator transcription factor [Candidatus Faecivivens stercoravium]
MATILIVEDEFDIRELLEAYLTNEGYKVIAAEDGEEALERFQDESPDLVLLDLLLPGLDGFQVCRAIREESDLPVIMLTALGSEQSELKGFDLRVDDYIAKPFSMPVLLRRVEAVLRRTMKGPAARKLAHRALSLDLDGYKASVAGETIELTGREFALLRVLLQNRGRVLTRQMLLNRVWGYDFYGDERIVDTHIKNLRKKLGVDYIETIRGVGYRIDWEDTEKPDR